ncbi:XRE family transcriptional regulator [Streptomyces erythrochromogenes]|uniref:XRE family transcriptional regulator n=1 Tax=Streptomyces erythrochromogenes TaxID=285574 RepID=UPI0034384F09
MTAVVPERRWLAPASVRLVAVAFEGDTPAQPQPLRAPDTPLGRARLAHGWSREKTVRALLSLAKSWGWRVATENSLKVQLHKWEHEQVRPGETYQALLCAVFQTDRASLGFDRPEPTGRVSELSDRIASLESLVARLTDALTNVQVVAL